MKKPTLYQFIMEVSESEEDEGYLFAEAVADVNYETEALGKGSQQFKSSGSLYQYDMKDEDIEALYEEELVELKKILEMFGVDVSEWDTIRKKSYYVQD